MTDSDENSGSFEVLEEEVPSPTPSQVETDNVPSTAVHVDVEGDLETLSGSFCTDASSLSDLENDLSVNTIGNPQNRGKQAAQVAAGIAHVETSLSCRKQQSVELKLENLSSIQYQTTNHGFSLTSHHKCLTALIGLLGITLVLLWTSIHSCHRISSLQDELSRSKFQHIEDLLRVSKERCTHESKMQSLLSEIEQERQLLQDLRLRTEERLNRDVQAEKVVTELQTERDKLLNELRVQSERHAAREAETANLILELQSERHQLMKAIEGKTRTPKSEHKDPWSRDSILKKLRKIKEVVKDRSSSFPGYEYLNRILCQIPNLCDDNERNSKERTEDRYSSFPGYNYLNKIFCRIPNLCDDDH